jgi:2-deoxy-D-gluconate 3-dehydrogenase
MKAFFRLDDQVIILTGGAGLLGRRYALALVNAGARVVVADVRLESANAVIEEISSEKVDRAIACGIDITLPKDVERLVETVMKKWGRIDGLVNNAAIDPKFDVDQAGQHRQGFEDYPLELWQNSISVNLTGSFLCCQAVGRVMVKQGKGVIVNVASTYGLVGPNQKIYKKDSEKEQTRFKPADYAVSKAGLAQLTRYLAAYWGNKNIRVNTLTPGGVMNVQDDEFIRKYVDLVPLGRMADKNEMCGALIFLLSEASSYMTGANLVVDGGWTAW